MLGKHRLTVRGKGYIFDFELKRKYTQLCGDSGTGKTLLYNLVYTEPTSNGAIVIDCDVPVYNLPKSRYENDLRAYTGCVFIVDEDTIDLTSSSFADLVKESDNYFLFETRVALCNIPISIEEIYELSTRVDGKYLYKTFSNKYFDINDVIKPDLFVTEGIGSDFQFFKHVLKLDDAHIKPASGASKVASVILDNEFAYDSICILVDGAAFGAYISEVLDLIGMSPARIVLLAPESFEYLLLKAKVFQLPSEYLDEVWNFCSIEFLKSFETDGRKLGQDEKVESWEQYYTLLLSLVSDRYKVPYSKKVGTLNQYYFRFANKVKSLLTDISEDSWRV